MQHEITHLSNIAPSHAASWTLEALLHWGVSISCPPERTRLFPVLQQPSSPAIPTWTRRDKNTVFFSLQNYYLCFISGKGSIMLELATGRGGLSASTHQHSNSRRPKHALCGWWLLSDYSITTPRSANCSMKLWSPPYASATTFSHARDPSQHWSLLWGNLQEGSPFLSLVEGNWEYGISIHTKD